MRDLGNTILLAARAAGRLLSYSQVSKWERCPLSWKFSYIDKIVTPPNRAMLMGTLFDKLCENNDRYVEICPLPIEGAWSGDDIKIVIDCYEKYKHHINYDTDVQQMGHDVDRFEFHVCNAVDDTIDIIKYKPRQNTIDRVPIEAMEAYEGMQAQWYPPNIDRHCTWCDHEQRCQNFTSRRLDNGTE